MDSQPQQPQQWHLLVASKIAVTLATCAYPVLTLILLNRPNTKAWFAAQAE